MARVRTQYQFGHLVEIDTETDSDINLTNTRNQFKKFGISLPLLTSTYALVSPSAVMLY